MPGSLWPRLGAIAAAAIYLLVGIWSVAAVPPWEAPDEPWHMRYVEVLAAGRLPSASETYEAHQPPLYYLWVALALRSTGGSAIERPPENALFPFAPAVYVHEEGDPGAPRVRLLRTFSGLLGVAVVCLTWSAARVAVPGDRRFAFASAALVAAWPQFAFIGHSLSNDVLAAAFGAFAGYGLLLAACRPGKALRALTLVATGLALGTATKLNVLAVLPGTAAAMLLAWRSGGLALGAGRVRRLWLAGLASGLALVAGLVAVADPNGLAGEALRRGLEVNPALSAPLTVSVQSVRLIGSLWARFGWLNVNPPPLAYGLGALGALLAGLGLWRGWTQWRGATRRSAIVCAVTSAGAFLAGVKNLMIDPQPQGRLLFPALWAMAILLALGWWALWPSNRRGVAVAAAVMALVALNAAVFLRWVPQAYGAPALRLDAASVRIVAAPPTALVRLESDGEGARQLFACGGRPPRRVRLAVARAGGAGQLEMRLFAADGRSLAVEQPSLSALPRDGWLALDVPSSDASVGDTCAVEVRLHGPGWIWLWATEPDASPGGRLHVGSTSGERRTEAAGDLFLIVETAPPESAAPPSKEARLQEVGAGSSRAAVRWVRA